ncbi:SWI/SNF and RSC complex subunit Ssr2 [Glugoides intestinalis]
MRNIFPIAQKAAIEETIGVMRPNALPPAGQTVSQSISNTRRGSHFNMRPKWFNREEASEIERVFVLKTNWEVFGGISDEEAIKKYLEIRNQIISMHEQEKEYISFKCIKGFGVEYLIAARIFDFLEDNKLINFQVGLEDLLEDCKKVISNNATRESQEQPLEEDSQKKDRRVAKYVKREVLENAQCSCGFKAAYFSSDLIFVCDRCFVTNNYPAIYSSRNFHKITSELLNVIWTRKEEYTLLKNIEMVGDDWTQVCKGTNKTADQCIFHFIKMTVLDDASNFPATPLSQVPNPISTFVAFVCSMVYPSISTELASAAIKYLNSPNIMEILIGIAKEKSEEVLKAEKKKLERLQKVEVEAMIKRLILKVDAINEMYGELEAVRNELEEQRERFIEETIKLD